MAKRVEKEGSPTLVARFPSEAEYLKYRKKMQAARAEMDEARGHMGDTKAKTVADTNMHADADRIAAKYANKSPAQQREFITHFDAYWAYLGLATEEDDLFAAPWESPAVTQDEAPAPKATKGAGRKKTAKEPSQPQPEAIEGAADGRVRETMEVLPQGGIRGGKVISLTDMVAEKVS